MRDGTRRRHSRPRIRHRRAGHADQGGHHVHEGVQEPAGGCQDGHGGCLHFAQGETRDGEGSQGWRQENRKLLDPHAEAPRRLPVPRQATGLRQGLHPEQDHQADQALRRPP